MGRGKKDIMKKIKKKELELKQLHETVAREGYVPGQRKTGVFGKFVKFLILLSIILLIIAWLAGALDKL
jgi:hypothetical protein